MTKSKIFLNRYLIFTLVLLLIALLAIVWQFKPRIMAKYRALKAANQPTVIEKVVYSEYSSKIEGTAQNNPALFADHGTISNKVGYVANAFSWGFNRHLCYDAKYTTWWSFFYRNRDVGTPGWIVYSYSTDNGKTWSDQYRLTGKDDVESADFDVYCEDGSVNVVYSNTACTELNWKRGELKSREIDWKVDTTVMKSPVSYSFVIPSITYYQGNPVISAHDQSEEGQLGGHKRTYVAMSTDPKGVDWQPYVTIFDRPINKQLSPLSFTSLVTIKNELYAIVNGQHQTLFLVKYLGDNQWSDPEILDFLNYGGGTPEWVTVTDSVGNLHLFYPVRGERIVNYAIFDGVNWNIRGIGTRSLGVSQLSATIDDDDNIYVFSNDNLIVTLIKNGEILGSMPLFAESKKHIIYINTMNKFIDNKMGVAWVDGNELDPHLGFLCLEKNGELFLNRCQ